MTDHDASAAGTDGADGAAGATMKARLRGDLRGAMASKRTLEVRVLRALIAAIDDAEAPPLVDARGVAPPSPHPETTTWRPLGAPELRLLLRRDAEERERAAAELDRLGAFDRAEGLRLEAAVVRRYSG